MEAGRPPLRIPCARCIPHNSSLRSLPSTYTLSELWEHVAVSHAGLPYQSRCSRCSSSSFSPLTAIRHAAACKGEVVSSCSAMNATSAVDKVAVCESIVDESVRTYLEGMALGRSLARQEETARAPRIEAGTIDTVSPTRIHPDVLVLDGNANRLSLAGTAKTGEVARQKEVELVVLSSDDEQEKEKAPHRPAKKAKKRAATSTDYHNLRPPKRFLTPVQGMDSDDSEDEDPVSFPSSSHRRLASLIVEQTLRPILTSVVNQIAHPRALAVPPRVVAARELLERGVSGRVKHVSSPNYAFISRNDGLPDVLVLPSELCGVCGGECVVFDVAPNTSPGRACMAVHVRRAAA